MNLYKILVEHSAPKDNLKSIVCYLYAASDEAVYEWLKTEPKINTVDGEQSLFNSWADKETELDEDDKPMLYQTFEEDAPELEWKPYIISLKGEFNDPGYDYSDAYYGITLYGWDLVKADVNYEGSELISLGIAYTTFPYIF